MCFIFCLVVFDFSSDFFLVDFLWEIFIFLTLLLPGGSGVFILTTFPLPVLPPFSDDNADDDCDGDDDDGVGCDDDDGDGGGVNGDVDDDDDGDDVDDDDDGGNDDGGGGGDDANGGGSGSDADGNGDDGSAKFPISMLTLSILEGGILVEGGGVWGAGTFCCSFSKNSKFSKAFLLT